MNDQGHFSFVLEKNDTFIKARGNAEVVVKYTTAYPFRLPEDSMVCVYCFDSFGDPLSFRKHMDEEHQKFNLRTAFAHCNEGYLKVDITELRCRLCVTNFDNIQTVGEHLVNVHQKSLDLNYDIGLQPFKLDKDKLLCAICSKKMLCLRQLSRHTQTHFLKFICEACGKSYGTQTTLRHHITYSHAGQERICRKCKKTFDTLDEKREHINESKKCWPYICSICGERFITWGIKQAHLMQVHGAAKKCHVCPECGESFDDRKKYRLHFQTLHTDDSYVCTFCGRKFDTERNLESHRVVHTKEKLFHCPMCSKSFPRQKNLRQHLWIHSESKRFGCTICNKQFSQRVSWKTHMKSYHPDIVDYDYMLNKDAKLLLGDFKIE